MQSIQKSSPAIPKHNNTQYQITWHNEHITPLNVTFITYYISSHFQSCPPADIQVTILQNSLWAGLQAAQNFPSHPQPILFTKEFLNLFPIPSIFQKPLYSKYSNIKALPKTHFTKALGAQLCLGRASSWGAWLGLDQSFHHGSGIAQTAGQFLGAPVPLDEFQLECTEVPLLIDVCHCMHQRTQDDFGVVLEEVDLKKGDLLLETDQMWWNVILPESSYHIETAWQHPTIFRWILGRTQKVNRNPASPVLRKNWIRLTTHMK